MQQVKVYPESKLAHQYCVGKGLEIGGSAHNPFGLNTLNVDVSGHMDTPFKQEEIRRCGRSLPVDIVAPGDAIPLPDNSQDFIVSSHVLEHFTDPIKALIEWDRLVRPGGVIFMIVPRKDMTFDHARERTPLRHLVDDYENGTTETHGDPNGHEHVWIPADIIELIRWMKNETGVRWEVVQVHNEDDKVGNGFTVVIRKKANRHDASTGTKFSFGVLVNDIMRLDLVFRQSQLDPSIPCHTIKMPDSAAKGLNKLLGVIEAEGADIAILAHQDMYFRHGWIDQVEGQLKNLPEDWVIAGPIGKDMDGKYCGKFHDMRTPSHFIGRHNYPHPASCFDECVLIVNLKKGFRFDQRLNGFDLYGTMAVLQTWKMGGSAWVIDAFCEHYCMRPFTWAPDKAFEESFLWLHKRFPSAPRIDTTVLGVPQKGDPPRWDRTQEALSEQIAANGEAMAADDIGAVRDVQPSDKYDQEERQWRQ